MEAAQRDMFQQDKIWSKYSNDKVDIAHVLASAIRRLNRSLPISEPLFALSVGSSNEPQFRVLESAFQGGLYLLDIEQAALEVVEERCARQKTPHVSTIQGDYRKWFSDPLSVQLFRQQKLDGRAMNLVTLHHSLYYSTQSSWRNLLSNLYKDVLNQEGSAIHAVLMGSQSDDPTTTTWLYNHFAGKFFNHQNDQDLDQFGRSLTTDPLFTGTEIQRSTSQVEFFVDDFQQFMAVVWMILLHPHVHQFTPTQQSEVIEYVYETFWLPRRPLIQSQDHLVIYQGT